MEQRNKETGKYNNPFPSHLRDLMKQRNISQNDLAQIVGKTRQTVSQYINGVSEPGYDTLVTIAEYFDVPTDYLLGKTEDYSNKPSAVDELGLSTEAVEWIASVFEFSNAKNGDQQIDVLDFILSDVDCQLFFDALFNYYFASKGNSIFQPLFQFALVERLKEANPQRKKIFKVDETQAIKDRMNSTLHPAFRDLFQRVQLRYDTREALIAANALAGAYQLDWEGRADGLSPTIGLDVNITDVAKMHVQEALNTLLGKLDGYAKYEGKKDFDVIMDQIRAEVTDDGND